MRSLFVRNGVAPYNERVGQGCECAALSVVQKGGARQGARRKKGLIMKAYELYVTGRKACWNLGAETFSEGQMKAAIVGKAIPNLTQNIQLSPKELRKYNLMRKYLGD